MKTGKERVIDATFNHMRAQLMEAYAKMRSGDIDGAELLLLDLMRWSTRTELTIHQFTKEADRPVDQVFTESDELTLEIIEKIGPRAVVHKIENNDDTE